MDYSEWTELARAALADMPSGQLFEAKELFPAHKWNALTRGDKIGFGVYFSNEYKSGRIDNLEKIERGRDNHARYRKL